MCLKNTFYYDHRSYQSTSVNFHDCNNTQNFRISLFNNFLVVFFSLIGDYQDKLGLKVFVIEFKLMWKEINQLTQGFV